MLQFFARSKKHPTNELVQGEKKVKVVCVDDHSIIRDRTIEYIKEIMTDADVLGFESVDDALSYAKDFGCDILFTEIELYGKPSGIELARSVQRINPTVNIIFTTVCSQSEYAKEVMELRPSGYLTKVVEIEDIRRAMTTLLYAV